MESNNALSSKTSTKINKNLNITNNQKFKIDIFDEILPHLVAAKEIEEITSNINKFSYSNDDPQTKKIKDRLYQELLNIHEIISDVEFFMIVIDALLLNKKKASQAIKTIIEKRDTDRKNISKFYLSNQDLEMIQNEVEKYKPATNSTILIYATENIKKFKKIYHLLKLNTENFKSINYINKKLEDSLMWRSALTELKLVKKSLLDPKDTQNIAIILLQKNQPESIDYLCEMIAFVSSGYHCWKTTPTNIKFDYSTPCNNIDQRLLNFVKLQPANTSKLKDLIQNTPDYSPLTEVCKNNDINLIILEKHWEKVDKNNLAQDNFFKFRMKEKFDETTQQKTKELKTIKEKASAVQNSLKKDAKNQAENILNNILKTLSIQNIRIIKDNNGGLKFESLIKNHNDHKIKFAQNILENIDKLPPIVEKLADNRNDPVGLGQLKDFFSIFEEPEQVKNLMQIYTNDTSEITVTNILEELSPYNDTQPVENLKPAIINYFLYTPNPIYDYKISDGSEQYPDDTLQ